MPKRLRTSGLLAVATSVLVALALVLSPIGMGTSQAIASDITITASSSSAVINELGSTTITLNIAYGAGASHGIGSWQIDLPYDSSKFTVGACTAGAGAVCNTTVQGASTVRIAGSATADGAGNAYQALTLGTFVFTARTGSTGIASTFLPVVAADGVTDAEGTPLLAETVGVTVTVPDITAPTILSVTTGISGYKSVGQSIPITITFSEPINATDSSSLVLNSGGTATCPAITASTTMACTYNVGSSQNSSRLDYVSTASLTSTGNIKDPTGNSAVLTLPIVATSGLYTANITVDTIAPTAPTVSLSSADSGSGSDGITNAAPVISLSAENYSAVAVLATRNGASFALGTGLGLVSGTGSSANWTPLGVGGAALTDGSYVFSFTATDRAGNSSSQSSVAVTVDKTAPTTVSIARASGASEMTMGTSAVSFTVTFNESVIGLTSDNFSVSKGSGVTGTPSIASVSGAGNTWSVTLGLSGVTGNAGISTLATLGLTVMANGSSVTDVAGNALTSTVVSGATELYKLDNTPPSFQIGYSRTSPLKSGSVAVTVTASEPLTSAPTISIDQQGTTDISSVLANGSGPYTYSYTVMSANGGAYVDGIATVSVSGADTAGNTGATITSGSTFEIDTTAPMVAIGYQPISDGSLAPVSGYLPSLASSIRGAKSVAIQATVSETGGTGAISGGPTVSITPNGGPATSVTLTQTAGGSKTWRGVYDVPLNGSDGPATVTLSVAGISDQAGNVATTTAQQTSFVIDNIAPAMTIAYKVIDDGAGQPTTGYLSSLARPVSGSKSVAIQVTGTETGGGGTLSGSPTVSLTTRIAAGVSVTLSESSAGSKVWRGIYDVPSSGSDGPVTVLFSVSGLADEAGNVGVATGQSTSFTIDNTAPTASPSVAAPSSQAKNGDRLTFSGSVGESGLTLVNALLRPYSDESGGNALTDIPLQIGAGLDLNLSGSNLQGSRVVASFGAARSFVLMVTVRDDAGNEGTGTSARVVVNNPATALIAYAVVAASSATTTFNFLPRITGAVNGSKDIVVQVTVLNATTAVTGGPPHVEVGGATVPMVETGSDTRIWVGRAVNIASIRTGLITVGLNVSNMSAGGQVSPDPSNSYTATIDNTPPSVSSIIRTSSAPALTVTTPTFTVNFSEPVSGIVAGNFAVIVGQEISGLPTVAAVSPLIGPASSYTVTLGLQGVTGPGAVNSTIGLTVGTTPTVQDDAGNALTVGTVSGISETFKLDNTAPTPGTLAVTDIDANPTDGIVGTRSPVFTVTGVTDAGGLANIQLQYATSSQGTFANIGTVVTATATSTYALSVPTSLITVDGTYYFRARVTDVATNTSDTTSIPVVLDTTKPKARLSYVASDSPTATTGFEAVPPPVNGADFLVIQVSFEDVNDVTNVTPVVKVVLATNTFDVTMAVTDDPKIYRGSYDVPADKDIAATVSLSLTGIADIVGNIAEEVAGQFKIVNIDNTPPTFASVAPSDPAWYTAETPTFRVTFSEPVTGVTANSFSTPNMGLAVTGGPPTIANVGPPTCSNVVTVGIGLNGATGTGEASSTFTLQFASISGITDCAGNALAPLSGQVPTGTFRLYPGSRPAPSSGGGSNSSPDPAPVVPPKPVTVVTPPPVVPPPPGALPPPPPPAFESGTGNPAAAQAFSALSPERAQSLGAALSTISRESAQAFGAALGGAGTQAATALLERMSALPASDAAALASVAGALPPGAAASFVTTLSTLPPDQIAAVAGLASSLPPGASSQVFSAIANLSQAGSGPVSFAPPAKVEKSSSGQETVSFDLADDVAPAALMVDNGEVAGARDATATRRTVVVLIKPGQVGRINRPKSGVWPDLALPVTAGKQAGLMPIFSIPADASAFTFEPTPGNLNTVQQGSLGGGTVTPLSAPFAVAIVAPEGAGENSIGVQMPSIPVATGEVFAYLFSTGGGIGPGFTGYLRAPAEFDPSTGRQKWSIRIDEAADVLFMPVALQPAYVANFGEATHIYSSPSEGAIDFGEAGPQFTTFTVVAPQVGYRIYVYNPITKGYGWIDAREVGPTTAPAP